ncbi:Het-C-domain-containing protein [Coprinopsis marcescibilis]|uniref:Het-C-domain-containing protein n=1 Tax=Coprinopsis marcescibilis TaxID=230819 RepID=A0A5C3KBB0_COPMA|nr:Het-C-domain-containing protein [Coprinopsis marcescibilis]
MAFTPNIYTTFLFVATLCVLLPQAQAFGAGDIPDFAFLNDKAFRHGDIESILANLAKSAGRASIGGTGLIGIATSVYQAAAGPPKFNRADIQRVYFGNWLRDYSQAMDIAGLSKLSKETLVLVLSVLGFMTFGYTTDEFEITEERLGVYLPVEHIDNPKGYAEKEGDARRFHPKLRPPVDPRELEIDPNTGMKNYMATENRGWDTSTAFIRRTFTACIERGRRADGKENADLWEAFRLLGTGLHTMEDLLAHSNWCELALRKMGHREVFCHVGDQVTVNTPSGPAPPLVTGTFGGADFVHSLLGEAGDKLSQASVTDLSGKLDQAQGGNADLGPLKAILQKVMGGSKEDEEKLDQGQQMQEAAQGYKFNPDNVAPPEVQQRLLSLLRWHDDVMRDVSKKVAMVPGLSGLLEEFSNALNAYIYTVLAPYLTPILTQAMSALDEGSKEVINNDDQFEVFDNPRSSDPSHSMLSKDHFGLILNEPAGKIAQILVEYSVNLIVQAWSDNSDPNSVIDKILEAFHHPYYNTGRSEIQRKMFDHMQRWIGGLGPDEARQTIQALSKESVRNHKNKRLGSEDQSFDEPGYAGCGHGHGKPSSNKPSAGSKPQVATGGYGGAAAAVGYGGRRQDNTGYGGGRQDNTSYGGRKDNTGYGGGRQETTQDNTGYSAGRQQQTSGAAASYYNRQDDDSHSGGRQESTGYGRKENPVSGRQDNIGYGGRQETPEYGGGRQETPGYGGVRQEASGYGGGRQETSSYGRHESSYGDATAGYGQQGGRKNDDNDKPKYGTQGGGRRDDDDDKPKYGGGYGGGRRDDDDKPKYGGGAGGRHDDDDEKPKYGGGYGGRRDDDDKPKYGGGAGGRPGDDDEKPKYGGGYGGRRDDDDKPKYGGGAGGRRDDDDKPKYGGGAGGRRDDDDDDDDNKPKYGGGAGGRRDQDDKPKYGGGGYGGSQRRDDLDDQPKKKYGKDDSDDEKKKKKSGKKNKDSDSDDDSRKKKGYEAGGRSGYQPSYGQAPSAPGYAPSYGSNETFGAERMKISKNSDDEDDDRKKGKYGGGRRY